MGIGHSSLNSPPPGERHPIRYLAPDAQGNTRTCPCNGFCALFAVEENLLVLESGNTLEGDTTIQDLELWSSAGCPLAGFLLGSTAGAGLEVASAVEPSFFKMMIWHKRDPQSGLRHQILNFEIPDSDCMKVNTKHAEIYAVPGSPSETFLKHRIADADLGSHDSFDLVRSWIQDCLHNHSACWPTRNQRETALPARVLEVSPPSSLETVRLHVIDGTEADPRYAALSYCWGKGQTFVTTKATIAANQEGMPLSLLHGTIRDAVIATRNLGIPYLWIDSLCIIQDCSDDKTTEISKMGDIYTNAVLTISAAGAGDCDEGFLIVRQRIRKRYEEKSRELQYLCPDGTVGKMYLVATGHDQLNDKHPEAIYERAWTHQERMLSPRMLTFGRRKLSWQCLTSSHCDFDIEDLHSGSATLDIRKFLHAVSPSPTNTIRSPDHQNLPPRSTLQRWWREVVRGYSQGRLSELPDKLIALSATARRFGWALQSRYIHGLWCDDLVKGMMWYSYRPQHIRLPDHWRRSGLVQHTWSWASVNGPVAYPQVYLDQCPTLTATASCSVVPCVPSQTTSGLADVSSEDSSSSVSMRLQGLCLGPFAWEDIARLFPSRTLDYEMETPNGFGMGWVYPDENDELREAGIVDTGNYYPKQRHEYWLLELSRLRRVRNGLVLRLTSTGAFKRGGLYSINTLLSEEDQREWESVARFRDVLVI